MNNNEFFNRLRIQQDPDEKILLNIQKEIKKSNFDKKVIKRSIENLSSKQKEKLKQLYNNQNQELKNNLIECKNKIISIKKKMY